MTDVRIVGLAEGASFLALLLVAMPLKYLGGFPIAVQIAGSIHGFLFLLYVAAAVRAFLSCRWSIVRLVMVLAASLVPLGPFLIDRRLRAEKRAIAETSLADESV